MKACRNKSTGDQAGVTLVELMIVFAMVAILVSVALPGFRQQILDTRRSDAQQLLLANASRLERCFTLTGSYDGPCTLRTVSREGYYSLNAERTDLTYILSAVPNASGGQAADTNCATLVLDHIGRKSATGPLDDDCWI